MVVGANSRLSGGRTYELSKIYVHELYSPSTLENDISLLISTRRINFGTSVNAVNYAAANINLPIGTDALVSGYGITSVSLKNQNLSFKVGIRSLLEGLVNRRSLK